MPLPKPRHLGPESGAQFSDSSVAAAYRFRPPYPNETYAILDGLIVVGPRIVFDLGCSLGEIVRRIAPRVERVENLGTANALSGIERMHNVAAPCGARTPW